jgi:hypothetical protein
MDKPDNKNLTEEEGCPFAPSIRSRTGERCLIYDIREAWDRVNADGIERK